MFELLNLHLLVKSVPYIIIALLLVTVIVLLIKIKLIHLKEKMKEEIMAEYDEEMDDNEDEPEEDTDVGKIAFYMELTPKEALLLRGINKPR